MTQSSFSFKTNISSNQQNNINEQDKIINNNQLGQGTTSSFSFGSSSQDIAQTPKDVNAKKDFGFVDYVSDVAGSLGEGVKMGVAGIAGLPGMITGFAGKGVQAYQEKKGISDPSDKFLNVLPTYSDILQKFDKVYKYDPQTAIGEFAKTAGEYLPGSGRKLFNYAISGGAATLDYTASKLLSAGYGDVAGFLFYLGSIPFAGKGKVGQTLDRVVPDNKRLKEAEDLILSGKEKGIDLTVSEAVGGLPFQQIASDVASQPAGKELSDFIEERTGQLPQSLIDEVTSVTGKIEEPKVVFNTLEEAVNSAIDQAKKQRSKLSDFKSAELEQIDFNIFKGYTQTLIAESKKLRKGDPLKIKIDSVVQKLGQNKNLSVKQIDRIIKQNQDYIDSGQGNAAKSVADELAVYNKQLTEILKEASPAYASAKQNYKNITQKIIDPLESLLDPVTKKVTMNTVNNLIYDPSKVTPTSIRKVAAELNKVDKNAFPQMAGYLLDQMITNKGYKSANPGFSVFQELFSNPKSKQNIIAILEESARSRGLDISGINKGFTQLSKILERMKFQPQVGSATAGRQQRQSDFSSNWISVITNIASTKPLNSLDRYAQSRKLDKVYEDLATMLTSSDGLKFLKEYGKGTKLEKQIISGINTALVYTRSTEGKGQ
jgi:hypothetical protein